MRKAALYALTLFIMLSCGSCTGNTALVREAGDTKTAVESGKVVSNVRCLNDSSVSYSCFIPQACEGAHRCPVIFCFDPHADGRMPVVLFSREAGRRGYILIGSNNSKNGIPFDDCMMYFKKMLQDVRLRFSIDTQRIYLLGFSGGARVASGIAFQYPGICGLVGCGAGTSRPDEMGQAGFSYLGVVGNADLNYLEMKSEANAPGFGSSNFLLIFDGIHQWPDSATVPYIMDFLDIRAMRDKTVAADNRWLDQLATDIRGKTDAAYDQGRLTEAVYFASMGAAYFMGFSQAKNFEEKRGTLMALPSYKKAIETESRWLAKEKSLQQAYLNAFTTKDLKWWKAEVPELELKAISSASSGERRVYSRLKAFLSLAGYSLMNRALSSGDNQLAYRFNQVYAIIDPSNPEPFYMDAVFNMKGGRNVAALTSLRLAVQKGFNDKARMAAEPDFISLKGKAEFEALLEQAKGDNKADKPN